MTASAGAVDATFAAFGMDAVYTPTGGEPVPVRVIARRPDTIIGFGETRIHAETAIFEMRASEVASPRPDDQLTIGGDTFVIASASVEACCTSTPGKASASARDSHSRLPARSSTTRAR